MFGYTIVKKKDLEVYRDRSRILDRLQGLRYWFSGFTEVHNLLRLFANGEVNHVNIDRVRSDFARSIGCDEYGRKLSMSKPQTKMLHELIALAREGKKFRARLGSIDVNYNESVFADDEQVWTPEEITEPWEYIEHKEPRNITFYIENGCAETIQDETKIDEVFRSGKWKVVCTEVVGE